MARSGEDAPVLDVAKINHMPFVGNRVVHDGWEKVLRTMAGTEIRLQLSKPATVGDAVRTVVRQRKLQHESEQPSPQEMGEEHVGLVLFGST